MLQSPFYEAAVIAALLLPQGERSSIAAATSTGCVAGSRKDEVVTGWTVPGVTTGVKHHREVI